MNIFRDAFGLGQECCRARVSLLTAGALWCALAVSQAEPLDLTKLDEHDPAAWAHFALEEAQIAARTIPDAYFQTEALVRIASISTSFESLDAARASLREAGASAQGIKTSPGQDLALRAIGLEWARVRDIQSALDVADAIQMNDMRDPVLVAIINLQIGSAEFSSALGNARRLYSNAVRDQVLRRIARGQAAQGTLSAARASISAIEDEGTRAIANADVASALSDVGNADSIAIAIESAGAIHSKAERDSAYVYISLVQGGSGDFNGAASTLGRAKEPAARALGFARLATLRALADDPAHAQAFLERAIAELPRKRRAPGKSLALCEIAVAQISTGQKPAARASLQQALQADWRAPGLEAIARLQARAEDIAGASATALQVGDEATRALLMHDITAAQAESGDMSGARATAASLSDNHLQVPAWFGIIGVQTARGDQAGAKDSVQMAQQGAQTIDEMEFRAQALAAVAAAHVKLGDLASGWSSFQQAIAAAQSLEQPVPRSAALANIAEPFHDP